MAVRRHAEIALRHYLTEVHQLGAELSISRTLAPCTPALQALAERSGDDSSHRADEPYRRALTGIYSRLAGDASGPDRHRGAAPRDRHRRALSATPATSSPICVIDPPVAARPITAAPGPQPARAADPRRAGVRLPSRHHRSAPELGQARGGHGRAAGGGAHRARLCGPAGGRASALCSRSWQDPRSLRVRGARLQRGDARASSPIFEKAAQAARGLRPRGHPPLHHQPHRERERPAGGAACCRRSAG